MARAARRAAHGLRQQARPRAGQLRPHARPAARPAWAPASPPSSCRSGRRPASGASPTCSPTPPTSTTTGCRTPSADPRRHGGARAPGARQPGRGHRRRRRRAARALPRRRRPSASTSSSARLHDGIAAASVFPVVCGSATSEIGVDRLADFLVEIGPSPLDRPVPIVAGDGDEPVRTDVTADPSGDPLAFVFKTIADPYVGQRQPVPGPVGDDAARRPPRQHPHRRRRAAPRSVHAAGQGAGARVRAWWPATSAAVAKLADTLTGDTLAPEGKPVRVEPIEQPEATAGARGRAAHPGRRRQAGHRPAPAAPTRTRPCASSATTRPTRRCCRARARPTSQITLETPAPQVRRQRRHRADPGRLPRDDHGAGRGRGPAQEADRRARPVRRVRRSDVEPLGARRGLRVRRQDRRRRDRPQLHPRRAEGRRGDHGRRRRVRLPRGRRRGDAASTARSTRSTRPRWRSRWRAASRSARRWRQAGPGAARTGLPDRRRSCPPDVQGDVHGRPQLPAGPGAGHRPGRRRATGRHRPRARRPRSCATPSTCGR